MRVRLYRNLAYSKQRAWSLVADEGARKGKVIDVVDGAVLGNATFYVSEAGRQYVIKQQKKKVHAWVTGDLIKSYPLDTLPKGADGDAIAPGMGVDARIDYNPYKNRLMLRQDCQEYVETAPLVVAAPARTRTTGSTRTRRRWRSGSGRKRCSAWAVSVRTTSCA